MKNVVIRELDNYRGRTEQRYQIMARLKFRNGLEDAIAVCNANNWKIKAVG